MSISPGFQISLIVAPARTQAMMRRDEHNAASRSRPPGRTRKKKRLRVGQPRESNETRRGERSGIRERAAPGVRENQSRSTEFMRRIVAASQHCNQPEYRTKAAAGRAALKAPPVYATAVGADLVAFI
jgi:hypothetical protein